MFATILISCTLRAQGPGSPSAPMAQPKNLKILKTDDPLMDTMRDFNEALGVQCLYCHVQGDFASDENPKKETARHMIALVRQAEKFFPSTNGVFPLGYHEVDCITCHRGSIKPETKSPKHFLNRGGARAQTAPSGPAPARAPATNLKVLAATTAIHGSGSIMEEFRDALQVDCAYCHSGGGTGFARDDNPRKDTARRMILMTREINAEFPATGVYPEAPQAVTCYTCHRLDVHPISLSNKNYPPSASPVK